MNGYVQTGISKNMDELNKVLEKTASPLDIKSIIIKIFGGKYHAIVEEITLLRF